MTGAKALIDQHIDAFNNRAPDKDPWASNAVMISPGGTFNGREQVLAFLSVFQQAFSNATLRVHSAVIEGGNASVEGTFEGVHDGVLHTPFGPVQATGKPVSFRWSATYSVRDLELASEHLYFDQYDFLGQLGLLAD